MRAVFVVGIVLGCAGVPFAAGQSPVPGTVVLQPAPGIPGVIIAGTRPEIVEGPAPPGRMPPAEYYVPTGGSPIRVADDIARPNGVQLSRDEQTLYVNDTGGIHAYAFDVLPDGRLANRRVFAT